MLANLLRNGLAIATLGSVACAQSPGVRPTGLKAGGEYPISIEVLQRPVLVPERLALSGPPVDTSTGKIVIDSVVGGSLFGTYRLDLLHLGLGLPLADSGVVGRVVGGDISIRFSPRTTDVGLVLTGRVDQGGYSGSWREEGSTNAGSFVIRGVDE